MSDRWSQGGSTAATGLEWEAITAESEQMNAGLNKGCQSSINTLAFSASKLRFTLPSGQQLETLEMHQNRTEHPWYGIIASDQCDRELR